MKKLFIIGNGFDLAHKIPSSYENFRKYLINLLNGITEKNYDTYDFLDSSIIWENHTNGPAGELLTILYFLSVSEYNRTSDIKWSDIERAVGELDYSVFDYMFIDESEIDKGYRANWINQDMFLPYIDILTKIPEYFEKWIKQLKVNDVHSDQDIRNYFDHESKFLCFNYTSTLEKVYNIDKEKICYIHGNVVDEKQIYFGHGNSMTYDDFIADLDINYLSIADGQCLINDILRKDVRKVLDNERSFFEQLNDTLEIYSYGFSYSGVDKIYIEKICQYIPCNAQWFIHHYPTEEEKNEYRDVIKGCGYNGLIKEF